MFNYFSEAGSGEPLILLHGNGEDGTYFRHQIDFFSKSRRVIAVDTRGHGNTPRGEAPMTLVQFAEDLRVFMTELKIDRADILGFSDGANIALIFALSHPGMVRRLILNGGNIDPSGVRRSVQRPIEIGYRIASFFARFSEGARKNAEILSLMVNEPHINPEQLSGLKMPVLVIAGTRDMIREEHTRLIHSSIPGALLRMIEGDHFIASRNSGEFNRAVEEFLLGA